MVSDNNDEIRMKLASKLVSTVSLKESNEEEFFGTMKTLFSTFLNNDDELNDLMTALKEVYSFSEILDNVIKIYAKNFTEDEMIDMINFFNTPTGKTWVSKYPIIIKEIIEVNEKYGASITEEILKKIDK